MKIMDNSRSTFCRRCLRAVFLFRLFVLLAGFLSVACVRADELETWSRMLDGLKERQYFDTAVDYLNWMKTSSLCPPSLKNQLDYQIALTHLAAVEQQALFLKREEHMAECRKALEKYLDDNPNGDFVFEAVSTQGRLLMEEGRFDMMRAEADTTRDSEREPLKENARKKFQQALSFFEKADKLATEAARSLENAQKADAAAVKDADIEAARGRYLTGKILLNVVKSDIAKTFPPDSEEFKKGLSDVAENFANLGKKYKDRFAGIRMRLNAAKAYRDLNDFKSARDILGELNVLQGEDYMDILVESLLLALDMNFKERTPERLADSADRVRKWSENAPAALKLTQEGQQIYLLGAKNLIAHAEAVKDKRADYEKAMRDAGVFLRQIRKTYPPYYKEAQEILRIIGGVRTDKNDPQTFDEAKDLADDDWKEFFIAYQDWQDAASPEDQKKTKAQLDEVGQNCMTSFNRAINMREEGTPIADVNAIRANMARIYAVQGQVLEAALLADYLARRYSSDPDADKTAGFAVRWYRQAFVEDKKTGNDSSAIADKLANLCDFILTRWPGKEVIGEVQLLRIDTAIDNGNLAEAKNLLAESPEGTPQRVAAELRIGLSLWNNYAAVVRLPEDSEERPDKKTLDGMIAEARRQLEQGLIGKIKLIESGADVINTPVVQSAMLLGQIDISANDPQGAIDWLTNEKVGPIALMDAPPPGVTIDDKIKLDATMAVLRAYVATENLDLAEKTMDRLEALIKEQTAANSENPEEKLAAERRLTQVYVTLGRQLENRLKELNESGEIDQAEKVAKGFESFLLRIKARGEANSFQSLYWVADTFYRLGSGLSTEGKKLSSEAENYYKQAARTYAEINSRLLDNPGWAPDRAEKTVNMRLAESLRGIRQYEAAMKFLAAVLQDEGNRLDAQLEAAKTLEAWGSVEPKKLYYAIAGGDPGPYVWGWKVLVKKASTDMEKFSEVYYNACLGRLRCSLAISKVETDTEKKNKVLKEALDNISHMVTYRAQLGGPEFFAQFDQIYRNLQRAQGITKPKTLKELQKERADTIPIVHATEMEMTVTEKPPSPSAGKPKEPVAATSSDMTLWFVLGGAAVLSLPLIYVSVTRKKKAAPSADKISLP